MADTAENWSRPRTPALLAGLLALLCFVWALGATPLTYRELRCTLAAHAMIAQGDWLMPRMHGSPDFHQPPLLCWLLAAQEKICGPVDSALWRLPSAMAGAALCALLTWLAARRLNVRAGWLTGLAALSLVALWPQNRSADPAALHGLAALLAALAILEIQLGRAQERRIWIGIAILSCAAALFAGGAAGLPLIAAALLAPALVSRNLNLLKTPAIWIAAGGGLLLFLAWAGAVATRWGMLPLLRPATELAGPSTQGMGSLLLMGFKILLLPLTLGLCALPVSAALIVAHRRQHLRLLSDAERIWLVSTQWLLWLALPLYMVTGVSDPRRVFFLLPLLAPSAGMALHLWMGGRFPDALQRHITRFLQACALAAGGAVVLLMIATCLHNRGFIAVALGLPAALAGLATAALLARDLPRHNWRRAGWCTAILLWALAATLARFMAAPASCL